MIALRKIQDEMKEHSNMILNSAEKITESVTENISRIIDEKLQVWDKKFENLKERVENQDRRLYYLEKEARHRNLVFFGLEEDEKHYSYLL